MGASLAAVPLTGVMFSVIFLSNYSAYRRVDNAASS